MTTSVHNHAMPDARHVDAFMHTALLYAGMDEFVATTSAFLRAGFAASEPMLVAVNATKIDHLRDELRDELGDDDRLLQFVDMAELGVNPARIIPAWRAFVDRHAAAGVRVRGIGEPVWAERTPEELVECQRHEALLNVAFEGGVPWNLLCPYDTTSLPDDVLDEAQRSHPTVATDGTLLVSDRFRASSSFDAFDGVLAEPTGAPDALRFDRAALASVRSFVTQRAHDAGFGPDRTANLVLAVSELAANSVRHGGGQGQLRLWVQPDRLVCEVRDAGRITDPLAGRHVPTIDQEGGRGLWMVNQLCELVQMRSGGEGTVVRLSMARP